ncbi:unnamed protein product [Mesocestoides corti]|uniref:Protein-lysine N-methyltransferase MCOS_LOCUS4274 n=1 Tax=Mesocestoides corti TaxID=53468 RepID=A0A0R3UBH5_MESCO|nr:unnamed protein product [Mesocestoides corti]
MSDLRPSALGTKVHWDNHYQTELKNYKEFSDEGAIWFGRSSEKRILNYLSNCSTPLDSRILDLGCGNGHFCLELAMQKYGFVTGIDYSEYAIDLAHNLLDNAQLSRKVSLMCMDFLSFESVRKLTDEAGPFDVVIDKGTFDAITLSPDDADPMKTSEKSRELYLLHVSHILRPDGIIVITSCNWTTEELRGQFERFFDGKKQLFQFFCEVPPLNTFTFGGVTGATTVCAVFKRLQ